MSSSFQNNYSVVIPFEALKCLMIFSKGFVFLESWETVGIKENYQKNIYPKNMIFYFSQETGKILLVLDEKLPDRILGLQINN